MLRGTSSSKRGNLVSANCCLLGRSSHNLQNLGRLITVLWGTTPRRALWRGRGLSPGSRTHKPSSLHGPSGRDSAPVRSGGTSGTSGPVNLGSRSRPVFQARTLCLPSNPLLMSPWHGFATGSDKTLFLFLLLFLIPYLSSHNVGHFVIIE